VRANSLWRAVLGAEKTVIEDVRFDEDQGCVVVHVRPVARQRGRCGRCGRRCRGYDQGRGQRRRWRALDLGVIQAFLEADSPRVSCPEHGVVVAQVPWARHAWGHTLAFDEQVAWLATQTSKTIAVGTSLLETSGEVPGEAHKAADRARRSAAQLVAAAQEAGAVRSDVKPAEAYVVMAGTARAVAQARLRGRARGRALAVVLDGLAPAGSRRNPRPAR